MENHEFEPADGRVLNDLNQIKVLADPLRVRILELLSREELTTKQVADRLGEKPTKLYHHVEALERVGLVRLVRTQPNRGTLEKYYRAVAKAFTVAAGLFSSEVDADADADSSPLPEMVRSVLQRTGDELGQLIAAGGFADLESEGLMTFVEIHASEARIAKLRDDLATVVRSLAPASEEPSPADEEPDSADETPERRYRLTLALFPIDLPP